MTGVERGTQLDRADVLLGLFHCWEEIDELLSALSDEQWRAPTALPGWRVKDVVAHVIGTESTLLGIKSPDADPDLLTLPHVKNEIAASNERWVRHFGQRSGRELLQRFRVVTDDRRKQLTETTNDEWGSITRTPVGPETYGRFMRVRTFDCWMHEQDIREAVAPGGSGSANAGTLAADSARLALDEIAATLGYIVGKLGEAPNGARIAIELTGPMRRTMRVVVNGRARLVDRFEEGPATSTIRLDAMLFTRLAGGRTTAAEHPGEIGLSGDVQVGQRIAERLNFVV